MKISKLFHWLYATLMFLPILMFLPSCLYFAFNEYATNETTTEINYKYQSNEVNTLDDLVEGNIYGLDTLVIDIGSLGNEGDYINIALLKFNYEQGSLGNSELDEVYIEDYSNNDYNSIDLYVESGSFSLMFSNSNAHSNVYFYDTDYIILTNIVFQFASYGNNGYELIEDCYYTDYNVIESVTTNVEQTIPQQINYAWNSVWNLPVFSWTQNSFISAPFTYITGLFGVQANNTLNYVFTYFCSISVCWLVFDLLMYVPNLAHRWLDKGAIE